MVAKRGGMPDWISYQTGDEPSLEVSVDVELDDDRDFRADYPYAVTIAASGFSVDTDGQPTEAAAEQLFTLEQRVESACEEHDAESVCTVSGAGRYIIYAYAANAEVDTALREALAGLKPPVTVSVERDDQWQTYERYVLRGEQLEDARDADQIAQLDEEGEDLDQPFEVIFDCNVPDARASEALQALRQAGFETLNESDDEGDEIQAVRTMSLTPQNLKAARAEIVRIVTPLGGAYDGWGIDPDDEEFEESDEESDEESNGD